MSLDYRLNKCHGSKSGCMEDSSRYKFSVHTQKLTEHALLSPNVRVER
jgi:hypothetical protein